ncbi:MAG: hypothetical protein U0736_04235 [Gemmataceae bacterium]
MVLSSPGGTGGSRIGWNAQCVERTGPSAGIFTTAASVFSSGSAAPR